MRRPTCRPGFTLIELLVVIAIITLLASILMPTVTKMRLFAMDSQCRALIHNVGTAYSVFIGDHGGAMPTTARDANGLYKDLIKYQPGPWYDPRCRLRSEGHYGIPESPGVLADDAGNRHSNTVTGGYSGVEAGVGPVMFSHITSPSTTAGLACFAPFTNPYCFGDYMEDENVNTSNGGKMKPSTAANSPWAMHGGDHDETNIFLLDGQVRSFNWGEVVYGGNFPGGSKGSQLINRGGPSNAAARQYLWTGLTNANTTDTSLIGWLTK